MSGLWQMLGTGLLLAAAGAMLAVRMKLRSRRLAAVMLPVISLVPVAGNSVWSWSTGLVGDLSVTTVVLLLLYLLSALAGVRVLDRRSLQALGLIVLFAGSLLYPMTLGLSLADPYQLGYGPIVDYMLLALALLLWFAAGRQAAILLLLVVLASVIDLHGSTNSWDYLLDPLLWVAAPFMLWRSVHPSTGPVRNRAQSGPRLHGSSGRR